jgi:hypothetical protein
MSTDIPIIENPLRHLGYESDEILSEGQFGAVFARAGVGKTSLLVQLALNIMLRRKGVLHISLIDPVKKISLWYKEIFQHLSDQNNIKQSQPLWETILPYRFIMTLQVDGFSIPRLEERLKDLTEQNILSPHMIIFDGLPFDESVRTTLVDLKSLVEKQGVHIWFTVRTHRHEALGPDGLPTQLADVNDLFRTIIELQPEGDKIHVNSLKGGTGASPQARLLMDPSTMLIKKEG